MTKNLHEEWTESCFEIVEVECRCMARDGVSRRKAEQRIWDCAGTRIEEESGICRSLWTGTERGLARALKEIEERVSMLANRMVLKLDDIFREA